MLRHLSSGILNVLSTFFFVVCLVSPIHLNAYSTTNVPIDDPVYRDIDKLVAAGLVKDVIYGQRPWSRGEIARIINVATTRFETIKNPMAPTYQEVSLIIYIEDILQKLHRNYQEELKQEITFHPLEELRIDYTFLKSPSRSFPLNGLEQIDGLLNPLIAYQEGHNFVEGHQLSFETVHRTHLSKYFSFYVNPRFEILFPKTDSHQIKPILQKLYGTFTFKNLQIEAGRDSIIWGQGEFGGGLLSNNARPLDMIRVGGISPFFLPSFLKYFGPSQFNFFVANLGPEREFPYTYLVGGMGTIKPFSSFEFSIGQTLTLGGEGSPSVNVPEAFEEFFGIISRENGKNVSNRLTTIQGRLTLPMLRNTQIYQEFIIDDIFKKSYLNTLKDTVYYITGLYIPRLTHSGSTDLRLEFKHFSGLAYRHDPFVSGYTLNQKLLGDEMGPDSSSFSAKVNIDIDEYFCIPIHFNYEIRDSDRYEAEHDGTDTVGFFKTKNNPTEKRYRLQTGLLWETQKLLRTEFKFGYEYVDNFNFDITSSRNNFLGSLRISVKHRFF